MQEHLLLLYPFTEARYRTLFVLLVLDVAARNLSCDPTVELSVPIGCKSNVLS